MVVVDVEVDVLDPPARVVDVVSVPVGPVGDVVDDSCGVVVEVAGSSCAAAIGTATIRPATTSAGATRRRRSGEGDTPGRERCGLMDNSSLRIIMWCQLRVPQDASDQPQVHQTSARCHMGISSAFPRDATRSATASARPHTTTITTDSAIACP